ncbi:hypothetical protein ERO13_A11G305000v2 [Gossypium hirsutum]|nr:hypothetical protein ERO13_A11G305000v2 [Gossypium hirsutum]
MAASLYNLHHPNPTHHSKSSKFNQITTMGIHLNTIPQSTITKSHYHTHKIFLFCNYILLSAASSCIFLTLALRLCPSLSGFFLILLHIITIAGAISGCAAASSGTNGWYATHMVATVLTAIYIQSYVREEDGEVILKLAGGLCAVIFVLEWVVMTLAFFLKYYDYVEGGDENGVCMKSSAKVYQDEDLKDWPWPFQV